MEKERGNENGVMRSNEPTPKHEHKCDEIVVNVKGHQGNEDHGEKGHFGLKYGQRGTFCRAAMANCSARPWEERKISNLPPPAGSCLSQNGSRREGISRWGASKALSTDQD